jgi:hypothetical protein
MLFLFIGIEIEKMDFSTISLRGNTFLPIDHLPVLGVLSETDVLQGQARCENPGCCVPVRL